MRNTLICMVALSLMAHVAMAEDANAGKHRNEFKGPVKVFILAGQSNMEGQGSVDHDYNGGKGNLVWAMANSKSADRMKKLKNEKGEWVVRDDVQISFKVRDKVLKGGLTVGYTGYAADGSRRHMGPELGFGFVLGDFYKEPVLLIKTAWGGKSLYQDFRPPSSGGQVGTYYTKMVEEVRAALVELGDQKYEIAGFYWQQGWNDMCTPQAIPEYAQNLVNLVKDLRKEFNVPNMPVVVGELGNGGPVTQGAMFEFRKAQEEGTRQIKNALYIKTTDFARPAELSPCPTHGHHWFANAESYFLIGEAAGEGIKSLLQLSSGALPAAEFHVAITGSDSNPGTQAAPLRTIQRAADLAQPGDTVTVHAGVYRERVNPPRGGESDTKRIVYQAASGEQVVITGSEEVKKWEKVQDGVWKATIPNTIFGGFNPYTNLIQGDWFQSNGPREHHTGAVYLNGDWLGEAAKLDEVLKPAGAAPLWFGRVDQANTTLWAQFKGVNPNAQRVEINTRQTVFYPENPGINYITVRGFTLRHAATQWAPPTAEQMGLIGTHWSKGWIIENNTISHSKCSGIALGKYGDQWDNTSAWRAEGYLETIHRALSNGWNKATVGSHLVRNNDISHCEQAGIVGSLGCSFSVVTGNNIHDIHVQRLFGGVEMAGIKFHGAIDVEISRNHLYQCYQGIWLDWMAQGARVSGNLLHDNLERDLFFEANHGPFLVDNNVCLSPVALWAWSEGGAYVHNLFAGEIGTHSDDDRMTPFHQAHSTAIAGLHKIPGGDDRYYNNVFVQRGDLSPYDTAKLPVKMGGNVFFQGTKSSKHESAPINRSAFDPGLTLVEKNDGFHLTMTIATALGSERPSQPVTSARLGKARISGCAFENPDGSPITIGTDYFGKPRNTANPTPGPFEDPGTGMLTMKVWPHASARETNSNSPTSSLVR